MMNTQNILEYLEDSKDFNESTVEQFEEILSEYPYFQTVAMLLTKNLFQTNIEGFKNHLPKTAALCADRKQLFYLINREKYKNFIQKRSKIDSSDRTEQILDSYLTTFATNRNDSVIENTETIVSTDYISYMQSIDEKTFEDDGIIQSEFKHQDIIDSFLEKAETNEIGLQPFQKETKKADKADVDTERNSFLTETLSKIYIKQKKYEQALTIIQQLSLNFPKKSAYFADQIRFLELLILNEQNKK